VMVAGESRLVSFSPRSSQLHVASLREGHTERSRVKWSTLLRRQHWLSMLIDWHEVVMLHHGCLLPSDGSERCSLVEQNRWLSLRRTAHVNEARLLQIRDLSDSTTTGSTLHTISWEVVIHLARVL
jgi:hypothetical protein